MSFNCAVCGITEGGHSVLLHVEHCNVDVMLMKWFYMKSHIHAFFVSRIYSARWVTILWPLYTLSGDRHVGDCSCTPFQQSLVSPLHSLSLLVAVIFYSAWMKTTSRSHRRRSSLQTLHHVPRLPLACPGSAKWRSSSSRIWYMPLPDLPGERPSSLPCMLWATHNCHKPYLKPMELVAETCF